MPSLSSVKLIACEDGRATRANPKPMDDAAPDDRLRRRHLERMGVPFSGRVQEVYKCCWHGIATTQRHPHSSDMSSTTPLQQACSTARCMHRPECPMPQDGQAQGASSSRARARRTARARAWLTARASGQDEVAYGIGPLDRIQGWPPNCSQHRPSSDEGLRPSPDLHRTHPLAQSRQAPLSAH